ncbi:hypothetical protein RMSM_05206 [Rhodopirellula maiorica SM1]|uniref:Uncharacterized protein n=1 Tax=Rhodopirellula maiorica SM1 TaxID=1265738 RepID=M5REH0_9BACT|nr:hypothetical protein [Rhodopirellula maiorica]EMI17853.1 hypothetical protein RMSM_05206 [Rhodopirellula maiorica SM1]
MNELSRETWREQCLLYLLDELPDEQRAEFDARLGEAEWFGDELAKTAETLSLVSEATTFADRTTTLSSQGNHSPDLDSYQGPSRLVMLTVALAASVLIAIVAGKQTQDPADNAAPTSPSITEATLVAKAWAQSVSVLQLDEESLSEFAMNDLVLDGPDELFTNETEADWDDSAFAWIVAAIDDGDQIDG